MRKVKSKIFAKIARKVESMVSSEKNSGTRGGKGGNNAQQKSMNKAVAVGNHSQSFTCRLVTMAGEGDVRKRKWRDRRERGRGMDPFLKASRWQ